MTLPNSEKEILASLESDRPVSLAEVERLRELWLQLRNLELTSDRDLHLPHPERILRDLEKLRLGSPPEELYREVVEVWSRHADRWAAPAAGQELFQEFSALETALVRSEEQHAEKRRQVEILRARCELLDQLGQVLDRLAGLSPAPHETDNGTGGEL